MVSSCPPTNSTAPPLLRSPGPDEEGAVPPLSRLDEDAGAEAAGSAPSGRWTQTKGEEEWVAARGEPIVARKPPPAPLSPPPNSHARYDARSGYECGTTRICDGNSTDSDRRSWIVRTKKPPGENFLIFFCAQG
jgi:hypothetical protein